MTSSKVDEPTLGIRVIGSRIVAFSKLQEFRKILGIERIYRWNIVRCSEFSFNREGC